MKLTPHLPRLRIYGDLPSVTLHLMMWCLSTGMISYPLSLICFKLIYPYTCVILYIYIYFFFFHTIKTLHNVTFPFKHLLWPLFIFRSLLTFCYGSDFSHICILVFTLLDSELRLFYSKSVTLLLCDVKESKRDKLGFNYVWCESSGESWRQIHFTYKAVFLKMTIHIKVFHGM
jgi:hypothetical protein